MKRIFLLLAMVLVASFACYAQQPKPIADIPAKPAAVQMPAEYVAQIAEIQDRSKKFADANKDLISSWQEYVRQQTAFSADITKIVLRSAIAAHLTIEQVDNSDLVPDGKGGYQWVPKAPAAKPTP